MYKKKRGHGWTRKKRRGAGKKMSTIDDWMWLMLRNLFLTEQCRHGANDLGRCYRGKECQCDLWRRLYHQCLTMIKALDDCSELTPSKKLLTQLNKLHKQIQLKNQYPQNSKFLYCFNSCGIMEGTFDVVWPSKSIKLKQPFKQTF